MTKLLDQNKKLLELHKQAQEEIAAVEEKYIEAHKKWYRGIADGFEQIFPALKGKLQTKATFANFNDTESGIYFSMDKPWDSPEWHDDLDSALSKYQIYTSHSKDGNRGFLITGTQLLLEETFQKVEKLFEDNDIEIPELNLDKKWTKNLGSRDGASRAKADNSSD